VHVVENAPVYQDEALGAANGLVGDGLEEKSSSWAVPMTVRDADGEVLDLDQPLADQLRTHSGKLLLLVHGLMATEHRFRFRGSGDAASKVDYGADRAFKLRFRSTSEYGRYVKSPYGGVAGPPL
jgi:hypothetical protein